MGNVCSSGQNKKKGSVSEKSEESFDGTINHATESVEVKTTDKSKSSPPIHLKEAKKAGIFSAFADTKQTQSSVIILEEGSQQNNLQPPKAINNQFNESTTKACLDRVAFSQEVPIDQNKTIDNICTFMLHGKLLPNGKYQKMKKIVIYILADSNDASTNGDSVEYKRYKRLLHGLHNQLSKKCQSQGYEFLIVDLQELSTERSKQKYSAPSDQVSIGNEPRLFWDIRGWAQCPKDAQGGHQEMANRLADLRRHLNENCFIIPILILGSVLGHGIPVLPLTIESQDFTNLLGAANEDEKNLLEKWYNIDNSCQPLCHRLNPTMQSTCTMYSFSDIDVKSEELYHLFEIMLKYFNNDLKDMYMTTVVEQEIRTVIFRDPELCKHCIWLQTDVHQGTTQQNNGGGRHRWWRPLEIERERRLGQLYADLRMHLYEKNIIRLLPTMNLIDEDITEVLKDLLNVSISKIFDDYSNSSLIPFNTNGIDYLLFDELQAISRYTRNLIQNTNSNVFQELLNEIRRYLKDVSSANQPLILYGPSGVGKSVLLAKVAENVHKWRSDAHLILRYTNLSARSSDLLNMLASIVQQLSVLTYGRQIYIPHDLNTYSKFLHGILKESSNVVILIDSINTVCKHYQNNSKVMDQWNWLPLELNANCKIILTLTTTLTNQEDIVEDTGLRTLLDYGLTIKSCIQICEFTEIHWQNAISSSPNDWQNQGLTATGNASGGYECLPMLTDEWLRLTLLPDRTPFYVKVLRWLQWMNVTPNTLSQTPDDTVSGKNGVYQEVFMLQVLLESSQFSTDHCEFFLLLIVLSKWGIKECDCLEIFQMLTKMDAVNSYKVWSRFCWLLAPWLQISNGNVCITEKRLRKVILEKYQGKCYKIHKASRDHYERKELYFNEENTIYNTNKLTNLPFHQFSLIIQDNYKGPNIDLATDMLFNCFYLTDLQWIADKVQALGSTHLLYDIIAAENLLLSTNIKTLPANNDSKQRKTYLHLEFLKKFFRNYQAILNYDGQQFLTLFKYHLQQCFNQNNSNDDNVQNISDLKNDEKICSWLEFLNEFEKPFLEILTMNFDVKMTENNELTTGKSYVELMDKKDSTQSTINYDALVYLPHKGNFVASISNRKQEIGIWDAHSCQRVRLLQGIPQPISMCPFGLYNAAVLCRREIKIFNLNEGQLKVTLKGVMNQKMPYFGLHDQKHIVCLSRNRMYVNLMNLESGDCVTTFKAGEDRFLNSLLVSGDGRILVCGDETQKPFPLLVWHLTQRKLLYDLRIPHHDFITALAAITHEGSYVVVVAKELNEPTPNFIVVYDLQSGTLFKKWKPSTDTVALAISQLNACVIAGLADAKIMVWDLVTGNCRLTLTGHNAPVTSLKLDPLAKVLLSIDKEGRDYALRLWELNTGKSLAVLKPTNRISAYEILPNGSHIIIGLDNHPELIILALRNYVDKSSLERDSDAVYLYGNQDNQEKIFNLNLV